MTTAKTATKADGDATSEGPQHSGNRGKAGAAGGPGEPGGRRLSSAEREAINIRFGLVHERLEDLTRQQGRIVFCVIVALALCIWNDWDIRRLARTVARGAGG